LALSWRRNYKDRARCRIRINSFITLCNEPLNEAVPKAS